VTVKVNTESLKTSLKFILFKEDKVSKIFKELAKKSGENILNPKNFILVPQLGRRGSDASYSVNKA
jgi:hypothetical protein